jgi:CRP-like cAMP-binding protein
MTSIAPDYFIHAANVLLLVAYCVRDILWLRLFAVAASLIAIPFYVLQPEMLWAPLGWSVLFAVINLLQSWRLMLERRPVKLSTEEEEVRRIVFPNISPRKVLQILNIGSWIDVAAGERLITHGTLPDAVSLVISGKVRVMRDGEILGQVGKGEFVGSAAILSGVRPCVDAVAVESVRAMCWNITTLESYLAASPDIRDAMQRHLARDLIGKLELVTRISSRLPGDSLEKGR